MKSHNSASGSRLGNWYIHKRSVFLTRLSDIASFGFIENIVKVIFLFVSVTMLSCANEPIAPDRESWNETGVSENVWRKAVGNAIDCGFHNLLTLKGERSSKTGFECVARANAQKKEFVYATYRIPLDSYALEILIRTPSGEYLTIVYDRMVDEEESQLWLSSCDSVDLNKRKLFYKGIDCEKMPIENWL